MDRWTGRDLKYFSLKVLFDLNYFYYKSLNSHIIYITFIVKIVKTRINLYGS